MKRRPRRSLPATLTALVILAACVLTAVVAIQLIVHRRPWISYQRIAEALHGAHWNDLIPALAAGAVALVGLVLLAAAVLPGKLTVLPLEGKFNSGASRRSYRNSLRAAASSVDGVDTAKLKLKARTVTAVVRTNRTTTDGIADAVRDAVDHRLDQVSPAARPKTKVTIKAARSTR